MKNKSKKFLTRDQVNENWNPVLTGETLPGSNFGYPTGQTGPTNPSFPGVNANTYGNYVNGGSRNIDYNQFDQMSDKPAGLDDGCGCDDGFLDNPTHQGKQWSLSATFINGKPLTDWSARFLGMPGNMSNAIHLSNLYNIYTTLKTQIRGQLSKLLPKVELEEIIITNANVVKIEKTNHIDISYTISFNLNERENLFCQFKKFNSSNPEFICSEISNLEMEDQLKIHGKLLNLLKEFLTPENGYYTLISKEFYTFNRFGQIEKLKENDVIEVIKSDEQSITFKKNNKQYIIKKPDYYYFNWFFIKK